MFLVSGATGNVGGELVHALVSACEQVRALTHGDGSPAWPSGVEVVTGDLNQPDTLSSGLRGARGVFLLSGYADMPGLLSKIAGAGVDRVVLLSRRSPMYPSRPSTLSTSRPSPPWLSRCRATTVPPTASLAPSPSFPPTGSGSSPTSSAGNYGLSP